MPAPAPTSETKQRERPLLWKLFGEVLPESRDVEMFSILHYPEVAKRCSAGMDRTERIKQLFTLESHDLQKIVERLILFRPWAKRVYEALQKGDPDAADPATAVVQRRRPDPARLRYLTGHADSYLLCDRDREWKFVEAFTQRPDPRHELMFLLGPVGEAHDEFCNRVQRLLPREGNLPRKVLRVEWESGPFPDTEEEFHFCLSRYFDCSTARLLDALGDDLAHFNLVLLHPCVRGDYEDPSLQSYYRSWWPTLLNKLDARLEVPGGIKAIQPFEWPRVSWLRRAVILLLSRIWPRRAHDWLAGFLDELVALRAIRTLKKGEPSALAISWIDPPLQPITEVHLHEFYNLICSDQAGRRDFAKRVLLRAATSEELLRAIPGQLPKKRATPVLSPSSVKRELHG